MTPEIDVTPEIRERARRVKMLAMDVDGVLTDAGMYYGEHGEELKKFNTRDAMGVALLREIGIIPAIITRESTAIVTRRAAKMKIEDVHIGVLDKLATMRGILEQHRLGMEEVAYIGDDVNDYELLCHVGLAVAVRDAARLPRSVAHYITEAKGGEGAVRELCELILEARRDHE
jgi:YrbI family 3-deoxy-D-manno-octulosonate 8-phosphate phosphatase